MALDHRPVDGLGALLTVIVVLGALALAQWGELRRQGMPPEWGNVPEWVAGIGLLAAFGALYIAAREWRSAGGTPGFGGRPASRCQGARGR